MIKLQLSYQDTSDEEFSILKNEFQQTKNKFDSTCADLQNQILAMPQ